MNRSPPPIGGTLIEEMIITIEWYGRGRQSDEPGWTNAVIDILVPFESQHIGGQCGGLIWSKARNIGVPPEAQPAQRCRHRNSIEPVGVDREKRAGQCIFRPSA